jgi:hypothetical protein
MRKAVTETRIEVMTAASYIVLERLTQYSNRVQ